MESVGPKPLFFSSRLAQRQQEAAQGIDTGATPVFAPSSKSEEISDIAYATMTNSILSCNGLGFLSMTYKKNHYNYNSINWGCFFDKSYELIEKSTAECPDLTFYVDALEKLALNKFPLASPQVTQMMRLFGMMDWSCKQNKVCLPLSQELIDFMISNCKKHVDSYTSAQIYAVARGIKILPSSDDLNLLILSLYKVVISGPIDKAFIQFTVAASTHKSLITIHLLDRIDPRNMGDVDLVELMFSLHKMYPSKDSIYPKKFFQLTCTELKSRNLVNALFASAYRSLAFCKYFDVELNSKAEKLFLDNSLKPQDRIDLLDGLHISDWVTAYIKKGVSELCEDKAKISEMRLWDRIRLAKTAACMFKDTSPEIVHPLITSILEASQAITRTQDLDFLDMAMKDSGYRKVRK
jgi:hypothetical protein